MKFEQLRQIYSESTAKLIQSSKLLVVGAGGIGCELVKCLSLSGFTQISIIDLDTIDVSNLNRQFLFSAADVGELKSVTAACAIKRMRDSVNIEAMSEKVGPDSETIFSDSFWNLLDCT